MSPLNGEGRPARGGLVAFPKEMNRATQLYNTPNAPRPARRPIHRSVVDAAPAPVGPTSTEGVVVDVRRHLHCGRCGVRCWRGPWGLIDRDGVKHLCGVGVLDAFSCVGCDHSVLDLPSGRRIDWTTSRQHVCGEWAW